MNLNRKMFNNMPQTVQFSTVIPYQYGNTLCGYTAASYKRMGVKFHWLLDWLLKGIIRLTSDTPPPKLCIAGCFVWGTHWWSVVSPHKKPLILYQTHIANLNSNSSNTRHTNNVTKSRSLSNCTLFEDYVSLGTKKKSSWFNEELNNLRSRA